jgi:hypothetical protein
MTILEKVDPAGLEISESLGCSDFELLFFPLLIIGRMQCEL